MQTYRTHLVIKNPQRVTLSNLSLQPGQHVDVLFLADEGNRSAVVQELVSMFKETQSLPHIQILTEASHSSLRLDVRIFRTPTSPV